MWKLRRFSIERIRQALEVNIEVAEPVVVLSGPSRAGKTSVLQGLAFAMAGAATGPDGTLTQEELRNPFYREGWASVEFVRPETGDAFEVARFLQPRNQVVYLNRVRAAGVGEAVQGITENLGASPEQLGWLATGDQLITATPLQQAAILCGTLGLGVSFEEMMAQLGRELADAVVSVVAPARAHTGWHMLESAVGLAEDARKLAGREAKAAAAAVGQARSALEQAMRAAQVADPTSLAAAITAQEENIEQARARAGALQEQTAARSALLSEVERAERAQQVAETRVAEARERIEQVAQQRAEVVARREALSADLSAARTRYEELVGEARKAEDAAEDPRTALDDARALLKALEEGRTEAPPTEACPCCGEMLALTANGLRWAAEVAAEGVTEEQLAAAREAVESAQADWQEKNGAFLELDQAVQEQRKQLERLEAALGALIDPPSDELLRERLEEAVGASDAAGELLGELRARPMPGPVDAQQIEAAQRAVAEGQERLRLLEAAQAAVAGQQEALQTETSANQEHERLDVLVKRLREIMREQASAMADPVADSLAAMLGRPVVFDPDRGLCLQVDLGDEQALRPLSQLCTGERLQAAAALQGVLAAALGVGLALVDEVSGLDPEHAAETIAVMREISARTGVVWVLATAQPLPELEGVQVVSIEAGYGGLVESASTQAAPVAATGSE